MAGQSPIQINPNAASYSGGSSAQQAMDQALHNIGVQYTVDPQTGQVQGVDPQLLQFLQEEMDAQHARDASGQGSPLGGALDGFLIQNVQNIHDFMQYVGYAETFARNTGYRFFPPAQYLAALTDPRWQQHGPPTQQSVNQWLFALMPHAEQAANPGAQYGMDNTTYTNTVGQYTLAMQNLTGVAYIDPGVMNDALLKGLNPSQVVEAARNNPAMIAQYPWLDPKYGITSYQGWQQYQFQTTQGADSILQAMFGDGNFPPDLIAAAIKDHPADLRSYLTDKIRADPTLMAKYSWLDPNSPNYTNDFAAHEQQVQQRTQQTTDAWNTLTGTATVDPTLLAQAVKEGWSADTLLRHIQQDPNLLNQYAYLDPKYNIPNYAAWQSTKLRDKQAVESRYGVGQATDANVLANLADPLVAIHGSGSQIQQSAIKDAKTQSEVR